MALRAFTVAAALVAVALPLAWATPTASASCMQQHSAHGVVTLHAVYYCSGHGLDDPYTGEELYLSLCPNLPGSNPLSSLNDQCVVYA